MTSGPSHHPLRKKPIRWKTHELHQDHYLHVLFPHFLSLQVTPSAPFPPPRSTPIVTYASTRTYTPSFPFHFRCTQPLPHNLPSAQTLRSHGHAQVQPQSPTTPPPPSISSTHRWYSLPKVLGSISARGRNQSIPRKSATTEAGRHETLCRRIAAGVSNGGLPTVFKVPSSVSPVPVVPDLKQACVSEIQRPNFIHFCVRSGSYIYMWCLLHGTPVEGSTPCRYSSVGPRLQAPTPPL